MPPSPVRRGQASQSLPEAVAELLAATEAPPAGPSAKKARPRLADPPARGGDSESSWSLAGAFGPSQPPPSQPRRVCAGGGTR
eukprot:4563228-Alexandrium_andersonii.AAC.1